MMKMCLIFFASMVLLNSVFAAAAVDEVSGEDMTLAGVTERTELHNDHGGPVAHELNEELTAEDSEIFPPTPQSIPPPDLEDLADIEDSELRMCRDSFKTQTCVYYKRRGLCKRMSFKRKCRQTCTKCKAASVTPTPSPNAQCRDTSTSCKRWAVKGYCKTSKHFSFMSRACKGTCNLCIRAAVFSTTVIPSTTEIYHGSCGVPKLSLSYLYRHKIVGGSPSFYGTTPWQVGIYNLRGYNVCGGVLIGKNQILTAAHCFKDNKRTKAYVVYLGKYHRKLSEKDVGQKKLIISRIIIHENYDQTPNDNDIAIVELKTSITFTNFIRPICLPSPSTSLAVGRTALVTGWGDTKDASNQNDVIQQVDVQLISATQCDRWMSYVTASEENLTDNMICAGYKTGGKDACQGDSGGPLIVEEPKGRHVLIGLVSWGFGCAKRNRPGIYTKIQNYLGWIKLNSK